MPTEGFVQLPPNSSGERIRTFVVGSDNFEGVIVADPTDGEPLDISTAAGKKSLSVDAIRDTPVSPQLSTLSSVALAAGMFVDLDSAVIPALKVGKLVRVNISASVPVKAEIKTVSGSTVLRDVVFTTDGNLTCQWSPPHKDWVTVPATGKFRVTITNQDTLDAADVYCSIWYDQE